MMLIMMSAHSVLINALTAQWGKGVESLLTGYKCELLKNNLFMNYKMFFIAKEIVIC